MTLHSLQSHLERSFYPPGAGSIDAIFRLAVGAEALTFRVSHGNLDFVDSAQCDATFYFADIDTAQELLCGHGDAFEAFMQGRFRADGYLMWAFALMAMFRGSNPPPGNPAS